jgi:hypothetical protein
MILMIVDKKKFIMGAGLILSFFVVLFLIFSPVFKGRNGLQYLDDLYNSISKGSAYYFDKVREETSVFEGHVVDFSITLDNEKQADRALLLFKKSGAKAIKSGNNLKVSGDLKKILDNCLTDADSMYSNKGDFVSKKYNCPEREVLYEWWHALKLMDKDLKKQKKFKEAKTVMLAVKKAVEPSYNYYKIEAKKISDRLGVVIFSLIFYVLYTLWFGFSIMFIFEGIGLKLGH